MNNASLDMMRLAQHFAPTDREKNGFALVRHEMLERGEDDRSATLQLSHYMSNGLNYGNWLEHNGPVEEPVMRLASPFELMVAQMVLDAVDAREGSYDKVASDAATAEYHKRMETEDGSMMFSPDYAKFYQMDLETACEQVAGPLGRLIYLALDGWWNDAIDWAHQMLDPDSVCAPGLDRCQHGTVWPKPEAFSEDVEEKEIDKDDTCPKCTAFWAALRAKSDPE